MKNNEKKEAEYLRIYKELREKIVKGVFSYGEKIPSKRIIAEEFDVSIITIEHAYGLLCEEGYIEGRERSGYYVIFKIEDGFEYPVEEVEFQRWTGEEEKSLMEFPISVMTKTMRNVISDLKDQIFLPSPGKGDRQLRQALKKYLARNRGILVDMDQIIIGAGSEYLYRLIPDLIGKDKVFGIETPSYEKIEQCYHNLGVKIEKIPMTKEGMDSNYLKKSIAKILHVSPYRSYPTGITATASKKYEYVRWAENQDRYLLEDDFESEFSLSKKMEETLFSLSAKENVIYMNTFSRTISPSLRVGYMVLPKILSKKYDEMLDFYSCPVPTYIQLTVARLIENGDFERHINRIRRKKRKENKFK